MNGKSQTLSSGMNHVVPVSAENHGRRPQIPSSVVEYRHERHIHAFEGRAQIFLPIKGSLRKHCGKNSFHQEMHRSARVDVAEKDKENNSANEQNVISASTTSKNHCNKHSIPTSSQVLLVPSISVSSNMGNRSSLSLKFSDEIPETPLTKSSGSVPSSENSPGQSVAELNRRKTRKTSFSGNAPVPQTASYLRTQVHPEKVKHKNTMTRGEVTGEAEIYVRKNGNSLYTDDSVSLLTEASSEFSESLAGLKVFSHDEISYPDTVSKDDSILSKRKASPPATPTTCDFDRAWLCRNSCRTSESRELPASRNHAAWMKRISTFQEKQVWETSSPSGGYERSVIPGSGDVMEPPRITVKASSEEEQSQSMSLQDERLDASTEQRNGESNSQENFEEMEEPPRIITKARCDDENVPCDEGVKLPQNEKDTTMFSHFDKSGNTCVVKTPKSKVKLSGGAEVLSMVHEKGLSVSEGRNGTERALAAEIVPDLCDDTSPRQHTPLQDRPTKRHIESPPQQKSAPVDGQENLCFNIGLKRKYADLSEIEGETKRAVANQKLAVRNRNGLLEGGLKSSDDLMNEHGPPFLDGRKKIKKSRIHRNESHQSDSSDRRVENGRNNAGTLDRPERNDPSSASKAAQLLDRRKDGVLARVRFKLSNSITSRAPEGQNQQHPQNTGNKQRSLRESGRGTSSTEQVQKASSTPVVKQFKQSMTEVEPTLAMRPEKGVLGNCRQAFSSSLLVQTGIVLFEGGKYACALSLFEDALEMKRIEFGTHHPEVGRILSNLGCVRCQLGHPARALQAFKRSIEIFESNASKAGNPRVSKRTLFRVAIGLCNMGYFYLKWHQYESAAQKYKEASTIQGMILGPYHDIRLATIEALEFANDKRLRYCKGKNKFSAGEADLESAVLPANARTPLSLGEISGYSLFKN